MKKMFLSELEASEAASSRGCKVFPLTISLYTTGNVRAKFFVGTQEEYEALVEKRRKASTRPHVREDGRKARSKSKIQLMEAHIKGMEINSSISPLDIQCLMPGKSSNYKLVSQYLNMQVEAGVLVRYFRSRRVYYRRIV